MKTTFLLLFVFFFKEAVISQNIEDQSEIAHYCINLPELQTYLDKEIKNGTDPLIIENNGIVPTTLDFGIAGTKAEFMAKKDLFFVNRNDFLTFEKFSVTEEKAYVTFSFQNQGFLADVVFEQENDKWVVKSKEVREVFIKNE